MAIKRKWYTNSNGDEISESEFISNIRSLLQQNGADLPDYINSGDTAREYLQTWMKSQSDYNEENKGGISAAADMAKNGEGSFWSGIRNIWNKITGNDLTDADKRANEFNAEQANQQRIWEEKMYQQYNSPEAQISSQMRGFSQNGINPALMYGGSAPSGGNVGSGSSASSVSPSSDSFNLLSLMMSVPSMLSQLKSNAMERKVMEAEIRNIDANTGKVKGETEGIEISNYIAEATKDLKITAEWLDNDKTAAEISSILKGIELTDSQILINGKQVDYLQSMIDTNASIVAKNESDIAVNAQKILESEANVKLMVSQINLNNLNAWQIRRLTPLMEDFQRAQTALYNAETKTESAEYENYVAKTAKALLEVAVDEKLLDSDYYDNVISKMSHETREAASNADNAFNEALQSKTAAENAWTMLFSEFFVNMTSGIGNLLNPAANRANGRDMAKSVSERGQSETTTVTTKEHRFDKGRDTRTTTRTTRR